MKQAFSLDPLLLTTQTEERFDFDVNGKEKLSELPNRRMSEGVKAMGDLLRESEKCF